MAVEQKMVREGGGKAREEKEGKTGVPGHGSLGKGVGDQRGEADRVGA